ncbi:MAG: flavin reductase family protein [Acidobacteria bacterium]|nr:flavin reductase family protein [Acidobacteriota bacterium]
MPSSLSPQDLRRACAQFATGITVVTVLDPEGTPHGMTANSFTSVSLDPPLVLVCVDYRTRLLGYLQPGVAFGVNVLGEDQQDLSAQFARSGQDRFNGVEWITGETGVPLFPGVLAALECMVARAVEGGDHAVLIAEVMRVSWTEGRPLLYFNSSYQALRS